MRHLVVCNIRTLRRNLVGRWGVMSLAKSLPALPLRVTRRIALTLCRVSLGGDLHERAADLSLALPLSGPRARRIAHVRRTGILFVHVPKCAGMAICQALYGAHLKHGTIRWYRQCAPDLAALPSFAIVREPVERFISAYRYAIAGGSADNRVAAVFRDRYRRFRGIDDAIDHVATTARYGIDHIFRPQHHYVEDADGGIGVDRLFCVDDPGLPDFIRDHGGDPLPRLNCSAAPVPPVSAEQARRIRQLYRRDVALHAAVLERRCRTPLARRAVAAAQDRE